MTLHFGNGIVNNDMKRVFYGGFSALLLLGFLFSVVLPGDTHADDQVNNASDAKLVNNLPQLHTDTSSSPPAIQGWVTFRFIDRATVEATYNSGNDAPGTILDGVNFANFINAKMIDSDTGDPGFDYISTNAFDGKNKTTLNAFDGIGSATEDAFNGQDERINIGDFINNTQYSLVIPTTGIPQIECNESSNAFTFEVVGGSNNPKWECRGKDRIQSDGVGARTAFDPGSFENFNITYTYDATNNQIVHVSPGERATRTFSWCSNLEGGAYGNNGCAGDLFIKATQEQLIAAGKGSIDISIQSRTKSGQIDTKVAGSESESSEVSDVLAGAPVEDERNCLVGSVLGWMLCPVVEGMYKALDYAYEELVVNLLVIDPLDRDGDREADTIFQIWNNFRIIANIAFALVFMVAVLGQALSIGVFDAYTFRKLIPRLVIAAVAVQVSFYLAAILIDIFNALGAGIGTLMLQPTKDLAPFSLDFGGAEQDLGAALFVGGVSVLAGGLAISSGLFFMVPLLLSVLLALLVAIVTLVFRKILIYALIVLSPIAFVAWILPNTDGLFKTWWNLFSKALMMYPLIVALIAAGRLAGVIAVAGNTAGSFAPAVSLISNFAPFFLIPATYRFAGGAIANLSGFMNDKNRGAIDRTRKWSRGKTDRQRMNTKAGRPFKTNKGVRGLINKTSGVVGGTNPASLKAGLRGLKDSSFVADPSAGRTKNTIARMAAAAKAGGKGYVAGTKGAQDINLGAAVAAFEQADVMKKSEGNDRADFIMALAQNPEEARLIARQMSYDRADDNTLSRVHTKDEAGNYFDASGNRISESLVTGITDNGDGTFTDRAGNTVKEEDIQLDENEWRTNEQNMHVGLQRGFGDVSRLASAKRAAKAGYNFAAGRRGYDQIAKLAAEISTGKTYDGFTTEEVLVDEAGDAVYDAGKTYADATYKKDVYLRNESGELELVGEKGQQTPEFRSLVSGNGQYANTMNELQYYLKKNGRADLGDINLGMKYSNGTSKVSTHLNGQGKTEAVISMIEKIDFDPGTSMTEEDGSLNANGQTQVRKITVDDEVGRKRLRATTDYYATLMDQKQTGSITNREKASKMFEDVSRVIDAARAGASEEKKREIDAILETSKQRFGPAFRGDPTRTGGDPTAPPPDDPGEA